MLSQVLETRLTNYLLGQLNKSPKGANFNALIEKKLNLALNAKEKKEILITAGDKLRKEIEGYGEWESFRPVKLGHTVTLMVQEELNKYDLNTTKHIGKYGDDRTITKSSSILQSVQFCSKLHAFLLNTEKELKPINLYLRGKILKHEDISQDIVHFVKVFKVMLPEISDKSKMLDSEYLNSEYLLTSGYTAFEVDLRDSNDSDKIEFIIEEPGNCCKAIISDLVRLAGAKDYSGYYVFPEMDKLTTAINEITKIEELLIKDWIPYLAQTMFNAKEIGRIKEITYSVNAFEHIKNLTNKKKPIEKANTHSGSSSIGKAKVKNIDHSFKFNRLNNTTSETNQLADLKLFHLSLVENGFIAPKTTLPNFQRVFSGRKVYPNKRVRWIGAVPELKYLINTLYPILDSGREKWQIAVKCFIDEDGSNFDATQLDKRKVNEIRKERKNRIDLYIATMLEDNNNFEVKNFEALIAILNKKKSERNSERAKK
ncbi:MAG: hypothetical protein ACLQQ4_12650 [Bacteroidia bacterium]